ncbi:MAG: hypothetical protein IH589_12685 [Anaerolineales bacterium]|nr:hypothetical protein [Anaerolineales bacterium]
MDGDLPFDNQIYIFRKVALFENHGICGANILLKKWFYDFNLKSIEALKKRDIGQRIQHINFYGNQRLDKLPVSFFLMWMTFVLEMLVNFIPRLYFVKEVIIFVHKPSYS